LLLAGTAALAVAADVPKRLDVLKYGARVQGCSCTLYAEGDSRRPLFQSEYRGDPAWANIDGRDVKLKLVDDTAPRVWHKGTRFARVYAAGADRIRVRFLVSTSCERNPECDGYGMRGSIALSSTGGKSETVQGEGGCGC
jgi:hypothetical protein